MAHKKIYFEFINGKANNGGNKARRDAQVLFERNGYKKKTIPFCATDSWIKSILFIPFGIHAVLSLAQKNEIIMNFHQFSRKEALILWFLKKIKKAKNLKLVALVHDLPELQFKQDFPKKSYRTENLLRFDDIIAHNESMKQWIKENGGENHRIYSLEIFDYLSSEQNSGGVFGNEIIIAGNLREDKTKYLQGLGMLNTLKFNLYGINLSQNISQLKNINYKGAFSPEEVITNILGSYGLVWDSETLKGGEGYMGEYQRYNNPHKISLYLAAGFPVIAWKEAALAPLVEDNNLGFVVNDLSEIPKFIENITEDDYREMKQNALDIGEKLRKGYFLTHVLQQINN